MLVSDPAAGVRRVEPGEHGDVVETPLETRLLAASA